MNVTLNDFRAILGKVNDGNVVFKNVKGQEKLVKVNYGNALITHARTDSNATANLHVRNALMAALRESPEGKVLETETMNRIRDILDIKNGDVMPNTQLERRTIVAVLDLVDHDATVERMKARSIAHLEACGALGRPHGRKLLDFAERIVANPAFATPHAMAKSLGSFNGLGRSALERFFKDNFATLKTMMTEIAFWQAADNNTRTNEIQIKPYKLLQQTVNTLMRSYADGKAPVMFAETIPPMRMKSVPDGLPTQLAKDCGLTAYEQNLDKVIGALGNANNHSANMLRGFVYALKDDLRARFLTVVQLAGNNLEEARKYVQANFLKDDVVARFRLIASLAHDVQIPERKAFAMDLGWQLSREMRHTVGSSLTAPQLSEKFLAALEQMQSGFAIRSQLTRFVGELYAGRPADDVKRLTAHLEVLLEKSESSDAPEMKGLRQFYDECLVDNAKTPGSADARLKNHVQYVCDAFFREEEAEMLRKEGEVGLLKKSALALGRELGLHTHTYKDADDAKLLNYGLQLLAEAAFGEDTPVDEKNQQAVLARLMTESKAHREILVTYIRMGLNDEDAQIAASMKKSHVAPIRDLLYDGYVKCTDLDPASGKLLGSLLKASLTNRKTGIGELFTSEGAVAAADYFEPVLKAFGKAPDPVSLQSIREQCKLNPEMAKSMGPILLSLFGALQFSGFRISDCTELFAELRDAGVSFDKMKSPEGCDNLLALMKLAEKNPTGVKGLDEYARRMLGKAAADVRLADIFSLEKAKKADPLDALSEAGKDLMKALTGSKRLDEIGLSTDDVAALRAKVKQLETAAVGTTVELTLAGTTVKLTSRASGKMSAEVKGVLFHVDQTAHDLRAAAEDFLIAGANDGANAESVRAVLQDNASEATPVLRRRELCTKVIVAKTGVDAVALARFSSQDLATLALDVLNGTKGAQDILTGAPKSYNSMDMVEMHASLVEMESAEQGSVEKLVKMPPLETPRSPEDRRARTRPEDVRQLAADLLMNADTWAMDEKELKGTNATAPGARIQALVHQYAPELANIKLHPELLAHLPPVAAETLKGILTDLAAVENPDSEQARTLFAQIETRLEQVASEAMQALQEKVTRFFVAKPVDATPVWQKSFDELAGQTGLDLATASGRFAQKILSGYFTGSAPLDQRKMFAAVLRNVTPTSTEAQTVAELLKGAGPLLQKLLQGLPESTFDEGTRLALADMKSRLPSIAPDAVKAQLLELVKSSGGRILSIDVKKSLGAASVGQAFLCVVHTAERPEVGVECVIKVLRPTAQTSVQREKEVFDRLADDQQRAEYAEQYKSILTELDFTREASNVDLGTHVYERPMVEERRDEKLHSMARAPLARPTMGSMMLQKAPGKTVDGYLRDVRDTYKQILDGGEHPIRRRVSGAPNEQAKTILEVPSGNDLVKLRQSIAGQRKELHARRVTLEHLVRVWFDRAVFGDGFFHGDLHAGNVMTDETGLTVIDFGNCGRITEDEHNLILKLLVLSTTKDGERFLSTFRDALDDKGKAAIDTALTAPGSTLKSDLQAVFDKGYASDSLARIQGAFTLLQRINVPLPGTLSSFFQSFSRLGGILTSMDNLDTELENVALQLQLPPLEQSEAYTALCTKLPILKDLDDLDQIVAGHPGRLPSEQQIKAQQDVIDTHKYLGTQDATARGQVLLALTPEERDLLLETLARHVGAAAPESMEMRALQTIRDLFGRVRGGEQLSEQDVKTLGQYFTGGVINNISSNITADLRSSNEVAFDTIVSDTVMSHQGELTTFAVKAFGFSAFGIGARLMGEYETSNGHKTRVASAREEMRLRNNAVEEPNRLSLDELTAIERTVERFCRPAKAPFTAPNWAQDPTQAKLFLETLAANRARLAAAIPGLEAKHLVPAFRLFSASEGPQGKNGPTWLAAIQALTEPDLANLQLVAQREFPEQANDLNALLSALHA